MSKTNQESEGMSMSNQDLKVAADANYQESASEMEAIYNDLFNVLDEEGRHELAEAQKAWIVFAERQAVFSSGLMRGGTAESLLYLEEMNSLVRARVIALREALSERSGD
jgi:uncharacterized protein YecT (DUF1311 family)